MAALRAAANWHLDLLAAPDCLRTRAAHQRWLAADAAHRQAWARLERLQGKLGGLPQDVAPTALRQANEQRRSSLKLLGVLLLGGGLTSLGWQSEALCSLRADERTEIGERRRLLLDDGSELQLNSDTALDLVSSARLREVRLLRGEIYVQAATDAVRGRPFVVRTRQGSICASAGRFLVRETAERTQVRVLQQTVEVRPQKAPGQLRQLEGGQQAWFGEREVSRPEPLEPQADAWRQGMLVVSDWALPRFIEELARYRPGVLSCDPVLGGLRLSGAFHLADSDAVLDNLSGTLPIRVQRFSRYWLRVVPS